MNYKCIDVSDWHKLNEPTKGSRNKQWVLKPLQHPHGHEDVEIFLFKESSKRYPAEFWAEIIAAEVGKIVGVPTPEVHCARMDGKYAALIKFFLKIPWDETENQYQQVEVLSEGGDLIMKIDPAFDRKKGENHNLFLAEQIFKDKQPHLFDQFLKILIFDTIIGNTDRHQDNWGFIQNTKTGEVRLAPAFDNSTSLGSELVEEKLLGYLAQDEVQLRKYISKGKAHIRWSADGTDLIRLNHFELLRNIAQQKTYIVDYINKMVRFCDADIEAVLEGLARLKIETPQYQLSTVRRNMIQRIICVRRDLLKKEFELL